MTFVYIAAALAVVVIIIYNAFVVRSNRVNNAFASIDVFLKQRADLIPALVDTVKGYMSHEQELLKTITEIRTQTNSDKERGDFRIDCENKLTAGIQRIFVNVESYPELKASENFLKLQRAMNEVEAQLAASRRAFNAAIADYNNLVQSFPSNVFAKIFGYAERHFFVIPSDSRTKFDTAPAIKL
jgi:LemA protein